MKNSDIFSWRKSLQYVTYIRVSTDRQGASGLGVEAQRKTICEFLERRAVVKSQIFEFVEIESGKSSNNRPKLIEAIKKCRLHGATLLVAKLDRLSRDLWFITTIRKFGVKFICADNPEINDLTLHILGAMAQYERQLISERTKVALDAAKARGVKLGNPQLAKVRNRDLSAAHLQIQKKANRFAREVLAEIDNFKDTQTLSAIARQLNSCSVLTIRGCKWTPSAVRRLLKRKPQEDPLEEILNL